MACQWEQFKATTPIKSSQQRQIRFCKCGPCIASRHLYDRMGDGATAPGDSPGMRERHAVLAWKPEAQQDESKQSESEA